MDIREEFIKEKGYSYFNNTVLNEYAIWLESKVTDNYQALQLLQPDVMPCFSAEQIERINKYARHQYNRGQLDLTLVSFEEWANKA